MKPETKIKALIAVSEATSKFSKAINEGRFSRIEFILNNLKHELQSIRMSENVFPDGGFITSEANQFVDIGEQGEEIVLQYKGRESEESFKERVKLSKLSPEFIKTVDAIRRIAEIDRLINYEEE